MEHTHTLTDQPWTEIKPAGRMLRPSAVVEMTGLSRSLIYPKLFTSL